MKKSISNPFPAANLSAFLSKNMQDSKMQDVVTAFGFHTSITPEKEILAQAIARQYQLIFVSDEKDVENIVLNEYKRIDAGQVEYDLEKHKPLYEGDSANNYSIGKWIKAKTYDVIQVKFDILNAGSVPWLNRKLVFKQEKTSCPIPRTEREINIPDIETKKHFTKMIEFETRGSEGDFICHFEMQDSYGKDCFPTRNIFDIRIKVTFTSE